MRPPCLVPRPSLGRHPSPASFSGRSWSSISSSLPTTFTVAALSKPRYLDISKSESPGYDTLNIRYQNASKFRYTSMYRRSDIGEYRTVRYDIQPCRKPCSPLPNAPPCLRVSFWPLLSHYFQPPLGYLCSRGLLANPILRYMECTYLYRRSDIEVYRSVQYDIQPYPKACLPLPNAPPCPRVSSWPLSFTISSSPPANFTSTASSVIRHSDTSIIAKFRYIEIPISQYTKTICTTSNPIYSTVVHTPPPPYCAALP